MPRQDLSSPFLDVVIVVIIITFLLFSITVQWGWMRGGRQTTCPSVSRNQPHSDLEGNLAEPFTILDFEPQLQGRDESLWLSPWKKVCMDCTDAMWLREG